MLDPLCFLFCRIKSQSIPGASFTIIEHLFLTLGCNSLWIEEDSKQFSNEGEIQIQIHWQENLIWITFSSEGQCLDQYRWK